MARRTQALHTQLCAQTSQNTVILPSMVAKTGGYGMTRMTAKDFDQGLLELYDFYAHGKITKREFLEGAGKFAIGG